MDNKTIKHLKELEAESIYVLREVAAQFERPVILFSGGKDSIVITYLAYKAFYPAKIPFPLLHIDTGHNFEETIQYRDELAKKLGAELIVGSVQESIDKGRVKEETGYYASRNKLQTTTLLDTLEEYKFDAAIGGARRDEEKARAKERFFSHRDEFGSEFLRQFITILDGFLEVMSCVDMEQREWNLCRIESLVGEICNHDNTTWGVKRLPYRE